MASIQTSKGGAHTGKDIAALAVPHDARMSRGALTMAWWAVCSAMFWLVVSATLALYYGAVNTLIGLVLSAVVYSVINAVLARHAIKSGLSVALFSRKLFGSGGAALATLVFFATAIYYGVFEGSVIAVAINAYWPGISLKMAYLIVVLYSAPLVFGSVQQWLDKLNGVLLPFYILGLLAAVVLTLSNYGYSDAWLQLAPAGGAPADGWWRCFTYFMGVWILMMYTWDYARFGKREDADYHARLNFGMPFYVFTFVLNGAAGIFLATSIPHIGAVTEVSVVLGLLKLMGFAGLLFVWVSQTRINTANFHLATDNMQTFFDRTMGIQAPRIVWASVVGVVVYLLMLTNVFSFILQALAYQGIFVVSWVGIAMTYILVDHASLEDLESPKHRRLSFTAWVLSSGVGIGCMLAGGVLADWSAPITLGVSVLAYRMLTYSAKQAALEGASA
ncbi:purine-cytosine permease family protein [Leeia oryzae]|uniref:purine-cytosine permease family protein n=1 Tax=Leeia oryzae TaxID=356662 RepID=UPI00037E5A71|nr:cytosine permease [Leeia oryzae]